MGRAIHAGILGTDGRDAVVECDDTEARDLLGYAEAYRTTVADKIRRALRLAQSPHRRRP